MDPKKAQKCGNTGSPFLDQPVLGRGGGGGVRYMQRVGCQLDDITHVQIMGRRPCELKDRCRG